jgi:uncharacterized protein (UPF0335 family)
VAEKKPVDLFEEPGVGDNSVDRKALLSYIERVENVQSEIDALTSDRKEIFAEAKSTGFDTKTMRKVIKIRQMDRDKRAEEEAMLDAYLNALGLL